MSDFGLSVVIPARDAGDTIRETLESLLRQSVGSWEAIVVDDGSSDDTASIVEGLAASDARIRLLAQPPTGVSVARNRGIEAARFPWLLFLDADDTVGSALVDRVSRRVAAEPDLQLVQFGVATRFVSGSEFELDPPPPGVDLFTRSSHGCPFPIHSAIVRRDLVRNVGAFDPELRAHEDWDLWIRCGRAGAKTSYVEGAHAFYRIRGGSASRRGEVALEDGLRVVRRLCGPDPRVPRPLPEYANGLDEAAQVVGEYRCACNAAGLMLAAGEDALRAVRPLEGTPCPALTGAEVAGHLYGALVWGTGRPPDAIHEVWPEIGESVVTFLDALETSSGSPGLSVRAWRGLLWLMVEWADGALGDQVAGVHDVDVDLRAPIGLTPPSDARILVCRLSYGPTPIGRAALPLEGVADVDALVRRVAARDHGMAVVRAHYLEEGATGDVLDDLLSRIMPRVAAGFAVRVLGRVHKKGGEWLQRTIVRRRFLDEVFGASGSNRRVDQDSGGVDLIDGFGRVYPSQDHLDLWFARRRVGCVDPGGRRSLGRRDVRRAVKAALMDELSAAVVHAALTSPSSDTGRGLLERARMGDNAAPRDAPGSPIGRCVAVPGRDARRDALQGVIERAIPGLRRWTGRHAVARSLPILLYHSVAPGTAPRDLRRFRVTPEVFETHLRTLADLGFYTVSVDQWLESLAGGPQLRGRPCVITFDDGYEDFDRFAWPQLKRFGFVATVFLVTERVGGTSGWDRAGGETPLMEWPRILDLEGEGVRFGSHTSTHAPLGALAASEVTREVADSRSELARRLKCPAAGLSYPYGDTEPTLPHLIREEGYEYAVGVRPAWATPYSDPFDLPRIEVYGWDSPRDLLAKLWPDSSEGLRR